MSSDIWYIQLLWVLSIILMLIKKAEKDKVWALGNKTGMLALLILTGAAWVLAQILNTPVIVVYRFGLYGFMFYAGYFLFSHDEVIEKLKKFFHLFFMMAFVLCMVFCYMYFGENYADAPINRSIIFTSYSWFGCLAILGGMAKYGDIENSFTDWMRKHSFGLYMFHYLGISSVALYIAKPGLLSTWMVYFLSLAAGFVSGYLLNEVISNIPFLRYAIMGIRKEEGNKNVER